jgi:hypothetical protein
MPEETQLSDTILVAHAKVYLVGGETFDLLPFQSTEDVKSEVNDLMENWAKSGFLLRGRRIYPWHQVVRVEVTSVDELSRSEAAQQLVDWETHDLYRVQQNFWKMKKARGKKDEKEQGKEPQAGGAPH